MAQWLRALAPRPELPESIPSTHMAAESCLLLQLQGTWHSLLAFMGVRYTDKRAGNTHTGKKTERKPSTLKGGRGVCTERNSFSGGGELTAGWRECGWERGHKVTDRCLRTTDPRFSSAKLVSGLARRGLAVWLVWDSAVPQAVGSSLPKDS